MLVASITARAAASGCKRSPDWASAKSGTNGAIGKAAVLRRDVRKRPCAPKAWQPLLSSFSTFMLAIVDLAEIQQLALHHFTAATALVLDNIAI
jgi:hypothetical protein